MTRCCSTKIVSTITEQCAWNLSVALLLVQPTAIIRVLRHAQNLAVKVEDLVAVKQSSVIASRSVVVQFLVKRYVRIHVLNNFPGIPAASLLWCGNRMQLFDQAFPWFYGKSDFFLINTSRFPLLSSRRIFPFIFLRLRQWYRTVRLSSLITVSYCLSRHFE